MASDPAVYGKLVRSLVPSVYGHEAIKQAVLLMLFGGVHKSTKEVRNAACGWAGRGGRVGASGWGWVGWAAARARAAGQGRAALGGQRCGQLGRRWGGRWGGATGRAG
jgi:hypothetical protein